MKRSNSGSLMSSKTQIPKGWQEVRLGDVAQFQQGGTPSKSRGDYWDGDIPFVTGADLREIHISRGNARSFLTNEGLHSGATAICEAGALLLATRTRVGLVGIASETMGASQDITLLTPAKAADRSYLYRTLIINAGLLQQRSRGTTIQGVSREDIDSLPILLPPLPEQRAIAAVLDSIDDAIEGAEAVIAATGQLRDSLLHQLLTRGVPGWHTKWKEAPGLGTIPAAWEVVRLGNVADIVTGSTPSREISEYYGGNVPWVKPSDLAQGRLVDSSEEYLTEAGAAVSRQVSESAVLVSCIGTIGEVAISRVPLCFNQQINALIPYNAVLPSFLYWACNYKASYLRSISAKTAVPILNKTAFSAVSIALPPLPEQQAIAGLLDGVDVTLERARTERDGLQLLKESTADALLTGRLRVEGT